MSTVTEIRIDEQGHETHESWIQLVANKVSATPGVRLFDSELTHNRYIQVGVHRCARKRDLNRDWVHTTELICELAMSEAQWGAFVSSFGGGGGVPATLTWLDGPVPGFPFESRLDESHREVKDAGEKALKEIQAAYDELAAAFDEGAGKKVMRERIHHLGSRLKGGPANMAFAAKSLTEHVETVVTKARADIEAMVLDAEARAQLADAPAERLLGPASDTAPHEGS